MIAHDQNWSMDDWITLAIVIPFAIAMMFYLWYVMK